ncbi:EthD domain-containing protein [Novosphingobium colocasiae]|uniref:EthD domain-containing protein n=1 Tax=Novosphingobium colocasiae TaxID=1256513 RepID=A0A918PMG9_9SPHN|nr:EthD domain-containing protein [Novosphingobium colocasiae]GGZ14852.1 hypothetical protein GCM10011614_32300 [Novosphingobium colocasiae]
MYNAKILAAIPRRKDISEQQFHDHWRHPHGTLSKKIACLRGYIQSHRIDSPLLPDKQRVYDGITELWFDSLDDALALGKDPAHAKYNIPDEPLFVDMDGLTFTFFEEEVLRSRPSVDDPDDAAVHWSPTDWSVSAKIIQLVESDGNVDWAADDDGALGDRLGAYRHVRSRPVAKVHGDSPPFIGARELWWPTLSALERGVTADPQAFATLMGRAGVHHTLIANAERII